MDYFLFFEYILEQSDHKIPVSATNCHFFNVNQDLREVKQLLAFLTFSAFLTSKANLQILTANW